MEMKLNEKWDGVVVVGDETVMIHNAVAMPSDARDSDYRPTSSAVETAQKAVDAAYLSQM